MTWTPLRRVCSPVGAFQLWQSSLGTYAVLRLTTGVLRVPTHNTPHYPTRALALTGAGLAPTADV